MAGKRVYRVIPGEAERRELKEVVHRTSPSDSAWTGGYRTSPP